MTVAIAWLWVVEKQTPTARDLVGVGICLVGMLVIATGPAAVESASRETATVSR